MQLNEPQEKLKASLKLQLFNRARPITFDELEAKASGFAELFFEDLTRAEVNDVVAVLTREEEIRIELGKSIVDVATFEPWLAERRQTTDTAWWARYEKLLVSRDWEAPVLRRLDEETDAVVNLMGDPTKGGAWARRGLLMGEVQSGKTATYLGILNKALDYGYRLVIVIGGHTEDLRRQTQARFDTDLLGVDSERIDDNIADLRDNRVGVGKIDDRLRAHLMTTVRGDFSKSKRNAGVTWVDGEFPTVFIVKKNAKLIANVKDYIRAYSSGSGGKLELPLIVIDDESDWGTPNTGADTDPTRVNREIRKLLAVSNRSSYLAITATPFANIFIDHEATFGHFDGAGAEARREDLADLFPSDYIRVMFPPSTYFGIGTYFGETVHRAVDTNVSDCLSLIPIKHKATLAVGEIPESMQSAIIEFLVGTAVRRVRDGKCNPASMLINVSRFNDVQAQVAVLVAEFVRKCVAVVLAEFARGQVASSREAVEVRETWQGTFAHVADVSWQQMAQALVDCADEFRVELVNSRTSAARRKRRKLMDSAARSAEDRRPTIFVGGDVLSRGLTLDGLQVSYFIREPRTMDTLMQMGRWFGYRPRFDDLVRIWMPESTEADFAHSADITHELRDLLAEMDALGLTPKQFGLRIAMHPESVDIVAANKAKHTEVVDIGPVVWQNRLAECHELSDDPRLDEANRAAVADLINELGGSSTAKKTSNGFDGWTDVPLDTVLDFFRRWRGHPKSLWWGRNEVGTPAIADHFAAAPGHDSWDVVLVGSGTGEESMQWGHGFSVKPSVRNRLVHDRPNGLIKFDRRRVSTASDLAGALTAELRARTKSEEIWGADNEPLSGQAKVLAMLNHPVLLLYAVTVEHPVEPDDLSLAPLDVGHTLVSAAVAFPKMDQNQVDVAARSAKRYRVNTVWWRSAAGFVDDPGDDLIDESDFA